MSAFDLWKRGQEILVQCLNDALSGKEPSRDTLNDFRNNLLELRKILRLVEAQVDGLDADNFAPWLGPSRPISCAWDLESICRAIVQTETSSIEWASISKWEIEYGSFIRRIAKLVETTQKATPEEKVKKRLMNTKSADCARRFRADKGKTPMITIVEEYVEKRGGSANSIMRTLNDNPDQWKDAR